MEHSLYVSPDDKINVVISNGDDHIWHVVWGVQMAFHGGPEEKADRCVEGVENCLFNEICFVWSSQTAGCVIWQKCKEFKTQCSQSLTVIPALTTGWRSGRVFLVHLSHSQRKKKIIVASVSTGDHMMNVLRKDSGTKPKTSNLWRSALDWTVLQQLFRFG